MPAQSGLRSVLRSVVAAAVTNASPRHPHILAAAAATIHSPQTITTSTALAQAVEQRATLRTISQDHSALRALHRVAMQVRQATATILLQFLLWCLSVQKSRQVMSRSNPESFLDFTTDTSDLTSGTTRAKLLYSKASSQYLRIFRRQIDAKGSGGDPHAILLITTRNLNGEVVIQGNKSKSYLCINNRGELVAWRRLKDGGASCVFTETYSGDSAFMEFKSVQNSNWLLAFKGNGEAKRASKAKQDSKWTRFMSMSAEDEIKRNEDAFRGIMDSLRKRIEGRADDLAESRRRRDSEDDNR